MEATSNGLCYTANELYIVFFKVKSTLGNFHNNVLAIIGCACETSVALSTFSRISHSHTCLTLKSGIIREKTLAITNDLCCCLIFDPPFL
jgi:hypothetical protein